VDRAPQRWGEARRAVAAGRVELGLGEEQGPGQVGAAQVRAAQVGSGEIRAAQVGSAEISPDQVGTAQAGPPQVPAP